MASKIDPKMKRKLTLEITINSQKVDNNARCQNLKNLNNLNNHKSPSFKMVLETFQTNHTNDVKTDPKTIEKSVSKEWCETNLEKKHPKYTNVQMVAPILKPVAWFVPAVAGLFYDLFSEHLGGTPWDPPCPILFIFWMNSAAILLRMSKIQRQYFDTS